MSSYNTGTLSAQIPMMSSDDDDQLNSFPTEDTAPGHAGRILLLPAALEKDGDAASQFDAEGDETPGILEFLQAPPPTRRARVLERPVRRRARSIIGAAAACVLIAALVTAGWLWLVAAP